MDSVKILAAIKYAISTVDCWNVVLQMLKMSSVMITANLMLYQNLLKKFMVIVLQDLRLKTSVIANSVNISKGIFLALITVIVARSYLTFSLET